MKKTFLRFGLLAAAAVSMPLLTSIHGQEVKFEDLKKKLKIDSAAPPAEATAVVSSYADALEKVMPAVVTVYSTKEIKANLPKQRFDDPMFRRFFGIPEDFEFDEKDLPSRKEEGLGSGVIISPDGFILTNNHVAGDADEVIVRLSHDKKEYTAEVIGADPQTDVALIKIDAKNLKSVTLGDSTKLRVGDVALAVGNPFGLDQTVTLGIISALGRTDLNITDGGYENFIQTDASINRGNSGGALVDASGRLIGINTAIQSGFSGGNIGIGFAIPVNMAMNIVERLLENGGTVKRGFLGVFLKEVDTTMAKALGRADNNGVLVNEVGPGTPAEKAGLKAGDLIVAYNGTTVESMPKLRLDISNTAPGAEVEFEIIRGGKTEKVKVKLGDLDDGKVAMGDPRGRGAKPEKNDLEFVKGVEIKEIDDDVRTALELPEDLKGVVVSSVEDSSSAAKNGLRAGQVITQVDQQPVESVAEVRGIREKFKGDVLLLQVFAAGRRDILAIPVK